MTTQTTGASKPCGENLCEDIVAHVMETLQEHRFALVYRLFRGDAGDATFDSSNRASIQEVLEHYPTPEGVTRLYPSNQCFWINVPAVLAHGEKIYVQGISSLASRRYNRYRNYLATHLWLYPEPNVGWHSLNSSYGVLALFCPMTRQDGSRNFPFRLKGFHDRDGVIPSRLLLDITWDQVVDISQFSQVGRERSATRTESEGVRRERGEDEDRQLSASPQSMTVNPPASSAPSSIADFAQLPAAHNQLKRKGLHDTAVFKKTKVEVTVNTSQLRQDHNGEIEVRSVGVASSTSTARRMALSANAAQEKQRLQDVILVEIQKVEAALHNDLESVYKNREESIRAEMAEAHRRREAAVRVDLAAFYQKENKRKEVNLRNELESTYKRDVEKGAELESRIAALEAMKVNWEQRVEILEEEKAILVAEKELDERKARLAALRENSLK